MASSDDVRFLNQATFGASRAALDELAAFGDYEAWVRDQFIRPISRTEPWVRAHSNGSFAAPRHEIWWWNATVGPDQLRQRMAFALSELFVVSDRDYALSNRQYAVSQFYDLLAQHAFGNFADLLRTVTLHPVMGVYLGHLRNEPADRARNIRPDENYAREVLQLFTIGLYELEPDGTVVTRNGEPVPSYDQATVEEFARVFTGWNIVGSRRWDDSNPPNEGYLVPMEAWPDHHDNGSKTLLQGEVLPAGQSAEADLDAALANILGHLNVAPFISRFLIQRLVTSNPTPAYVERVASVFEGRAGEGSSDGRERGDLGSVVMAILLDVEARNGHVDLPERFGKIKEPIMRLTQLWRAFDAEPGRSAEDGVLRPYARPVQQLSDVLGQAPLRSPSVFNFFQPDHRLAPGSELVAPELQILSEIEVAITNNMLFGSIQTDHRGNPEATDNRANITKVDIERELALADRPAELVRHLDVLLTGATLPTAFTDAITAHVAAQPDDADGRRQGTVDAITAVVSSPYHLVQR